MNNDNTKQQQSTKTKAESSGKANYKYYRNNFYKRYYNASPWYRSNFRKPVAQLQNNVNNNVNNKAVKRSASPLASRSRSSDNINNQNNNNNNAATKANNVDVEALINSVKTYVDNKFKDNSESISNVITPKLRNSINAQVENRCKYYIDQRIGLMLNSDDLLTRGSNSFTISPDASHGAKSFYFNYMNEPVAYVTYDGRLYCNGLFLNGVNILQTISKMMDDETSVAQALSNYVKHVELHDGTYELNVRDTVTKQLAITNDDNSEYVYFKYDDDNNKLAINFNDDAAKLTIDTAGNTNITGSLTVASTISCNGLYSSDNITADGLLTCTQLDVANYTKNTWYAKFRTEDYLSNNEYIRIMLKDLGGQANIDLTHDTQYYGLRLQVPTANTDDNKLCIWPTGVTIDGQVDMYNDVTCWQNLIIGKDITMQNYYKLYTNYIYPIPDTGNNIYTTGYITVTNGHVTILDNNVTTGSWKNLFTIGKWYGTNNIGLDYYYDENTPKNCGWRLSHTNGGTLIGGDYYTTYVYTSTFNHLANATYVTHRIGKDSSNCLTILHTMDYDTNPVTFKLTRYNQAETDMLKLYGTNIEVPSGISLKFDSTSVVSVVNSALNISSGLSVTAGVVSDNIYTINGPGTYDATKTIRENLGIHLNNTPTICAIAGFPGGTDCGLLIGVNDARSFMLTCNKDYGDGDNFRLYHCANGGGATQGYRYYASAYSRILTHRNYNANITSLTNLTALTIKNTTITSGLYNTLLSVYAPNLTSNTSANINLGVAASNNNQAHIVFNYIGNGSTNNHLEVAIHGTGHIIDIYSTMVHINKPTTFTAKIDTTQTTVNNALGSNLKAVICDLIYPVGSIYTSFNSTSPVTLFGVGTWVQITDRFLYCANSSGVGGGSATHHHAFSLRHGLSYDNIVGAAHHSSAWGGIEVKDYDDNAWHGGYHRDNLTGLQCTSDSAAGSPWRVYQDTYANTSYESSMPPYITVYAWHRTA